MRLKRIVLGLLALLGAVVLVACGAGTKKSADFQLLTQGQSDIRNHIEYQGDKMTLLKTTTTVLYSAIGANSKDDAKLMMEEQGSADWDGIKGITHEVEFKDDRLIETTSVDLNKVDLATLNELMPIETTDGKIPEYLSYKLTKENFLNQGYTEVKDGKFKELE